MESTKKCPWCAEEILVEAKKCKHCGEFLTGGGRTEVVAKQSRTPPAGDVLRCDRCSKVVSSSRELYLHLVNVHGKLETQPAASYSGSGGRKTLSQVGNRTDGGVACPKCGGTQFTAKRSKKAKVGLLPLAILIPLAPKSQVQCVACGTMFKRG